MKKHKENIFTRKFHLLSSQESQDINWSSSDSSDLEKKSVNVDKVCNFTKKTSRKRKRKSTGHRNLSNLDITVIDITKEREDAKTRNNFEEHNIVPLNIHSGVKSPIIGSTQYFAPFKCSDGPSSPIISSKTFEFRSKFDKTSKSPILVLKTASPKISPNVRKKLFKSDSKTDVSSNNNINIPTQNSCLDRRKCDIEKNHDNVILVETKLKECKHEFPSLSKATKGHNSQKNCSNYISPLKDNLPIFNNKTFIVKQEKESPNKTTSFKIIDPSQDIKSDETCIIDETPEPNMNESSAMLKTSGLGLAKKVKSFFDNEFGSDNPSQQTISEVSTPRNTSKTSDEIEIVNITTQVLSNRNSNESIKENGTFLESDKKEKKIRYKKDGLAYRLNNLLKKQTASISLWQHERFLALNSNFVIPKGEFLAFRICKVNFKYGCYLLETMDFNDDDYFILINRCHHNETFLENGIIKLYEPYTKVELSKCKLLINVTKFECVSIKK